MRNLIRRIKLPFDALSEDRGSVVIITVVNLFFFTVFGFVTLDVGLFMNERRDAQSDVDRIALAGALELTLDVDLAQQSIDEAAALAMAASWAEANGVDPVDPRYSATVIYNCFSADDGFPTGVTVTVERTPLAFFITLFGIVDWEVSATATACAGRPVELFGFLPFALSESSSCFKNGVDGKGNLIRVPLLGERCDIDVEVGSTGLVGELGLDSDGPCGEGNSSAAVLETNIINGVQTTCRIGDIVEANAGHNVGKTKSGILARLSTEGACDTNFFGALANFDDGTAALNAVLADAGSPLLANPARGDGMDDFYEIWEWAGGDIPVGPTSPHPADELVQYDCDPGLAGEPGIQTSPRNASLIVVKDFSEPDIEPKSYIITNFARMYLEGCTKDDVFYKDCDYPGGGRFTIHARFVEQVSNDQSDLGLEATFGDISIFLKR